MNQYLDFEGTIGIQRNILKTGNLSYQTVTNITGTNKELLEDFKNRIKFGKIRGPYFRENKSRRNIFHWTVNKNERKKLLPFILPYLHLKWRQAQLAIEVDSIIKDSNILNNEKYSWEEMSILDFCYQECKELNNKYIIRKDK